jgi:hypothetical protein
MLLLFYHLITELLFIKFKVLFIWVFFWFFFFWVGWSLNSVPQACKAGALPHELHLQSILLWLFLEMGTYELFPQAGLKP